MILRCGVVLLVLGGMTGCELVGNIDKRQLAASSDGDSGTTPVTVDAGPPAADLSHCVLPGTGAGYMRLANLVPTAQRVDVCLRPSSASSFASVQPVFASAGPLCSAGLGYKDVTISLSVPADTYAVNFVPAGQPCTAQALAGLPSALVADQPIAVSLLGNGRQAPTARRYVESRSPSTGASVLRLYNAAEDLGSLDFGIGTAETLPTSVALVEIGKLGFGDATPNDPTQTAVDSNGYISQTLGSTQLAYAVAPTGSKSAELLTVRSVPSGGAFSFFAVGRTDTPDFPTELFGCDELTQPGFVLANCSELPAVTFTADTVNLQLSGTFAGAEAARRPAGIAAVAALSSDYVCVTEVYSLADKNSIIAAAKTQFPYSYYPPTDEQTLPTNPNNLADAAVPRSSTPACSTDNAQSAMNALVDCMRDNCSTALGSETGTAIQNAESCLSKSCGIQVLDLVNGTADLAMCWGCVFSQYNDYATMADIRTGCTTDPLVGEGFNGQSGVLMLSRQPLTNTSYYLLPSTGVWQSVTAKATVVLDNNASVDLYCGAGISTASNCTLSPSTIQSPLGANPDGTMPADCIGVSVNEQALFNTRMRDWVASTSGVAKAKTIFSGDLYCGPSYKNTIQALQPTNFGILSAAMSLGTAASFVPECTDCVTNAMRTPPGSTPSGDNTWTRFHLTQNIPVTAVQSNEVFLKDNVVDGGPGNGSTKVPISTYYAYRSVFSITP